MADQPIIRTPKRKRGESKFTGSPIQPTTQFSFRVSQAQDEDVGGSASPRARFVHKFKGLHLHDQSGGGVTIGNPSPAAATSEMATPVTTDKAADTEGHTEPIFSQQPPTATRTGDEHIHLDDYEDDEESIGRKRQKVPELVMRDADGADPADTIHVHMSSPPMPRTAAPPASESETVPADVTDHRSTIEAKPRRVGTPPLRKSRKKTSPADGEGEDDDDDDDDGDSPVIVDPVRAALTWQDDEITVYDPDDSDDDGTGVNGVGFKPTPAIARMRVQKRRQQLAEYRRREEKEARALRNYRRRGGGGSSNGGSGSAALASAVTEGTKKSAEDSRRVRFMEAEVSAIVLTS